MEGAVSTGLNFHILSLSQSCFSTLAGGLFGTSTGGGGGLGTGLFGQTPTTQVAGGGLFGQGTGGGILGGGQTGGGLFQSPQCKYVYFTIRNVVG